MEPDQLTMLALKRLGAALETDQDRCRSCAQPVWEVRGVLAAHVSDELSKDAPEEDVAAADEAYELSSWCDEANGAHVRGYLAPNGLRRAAEVLLEVVGELPPMERELETAGRLEADGWGGSPRELLEAALELSGE
jgi:hypothetical protein